MALKLAEEQAEREEAAVKEEEATNPMKLLEKRTEASKNEMASLEALEELRELNQRKVNLDYDTMLDKYDVMRDADSNQFQEEDDRLIEYAGFTNNWHCTIKFSFVFSSLKMFFFTICRQLFGKNGQVIRRIEGSDDSDDDEPSKKKKFMSSASNLKATDFLVSTNGGEDVKPSLVAKPVAQSTNEKSVGMLSVNRKKLVLVKPKVELKAEMKTELPTNSTSGGGSLSLLGAYSSSDENSD